MKTTMENIVFVILHYLTTEVTKKCVQSIEENCDTKKYRIIIVDNNSPNDSFLELSHFYENNEKIQIIKNIENLGFAKGNNVGYMYAKKNYNPEYIVLVNNDVIIYEKKLFEKLSEEYSKSKFSVAGPKVYTQDGNTNSNPFIPFEPTVEWLSYRIKKRNWEIFWSFFGLYEKVCPFVHKMLKKMNIFQEPECKIIIEKNKENDTKCYNVGLHGCCLFFSRKYIEEYDGLCDKTYMGGEEMILFVQMMCDGKKTVYIPEIEIMHLEGFSTKASGKIQKKRTPKAFLASKRSYKISRDILKKAK